MKGDVARAELGRTPFRASARKSPRASPRGTAGFPLHDDEAAELTVTLDTYVPPEKPKPSVSTGWRPCAPSARRRSRAACARRTRRRRPSRGRCASTARRRRRRRTRSRRRGVRRVPLPLSRLRYSPEPGGGECGLDPERAQDRHRARRRHGRGPEALPRGSSRRMAVRLRWSAARPARGPRPCSGARPRAAGGRRRRGRGAPATGRASPGLTRGVADAAEALAALAQLFRVVGRERERVRLRRLDRQ